MTCLEDDFLRYSYVTLNRDIVEMTVGEAKKDGPTYNEFGQNENLVIMSRFLCIKIIDLQC